MPETREIGTGVLWGQLGLVRQGPLGSLVQSRRKRSLWCKTVMGAASEQRGPPPPQLLRELTAKAAELFPHFNLISSKECDLILQSQAGEA